MTEINKEEFIKLLKQLTDEQYDVNVSMDEQDDMAILAQESPQHDFFKLAGTVDRKIFKTRSLSFKAKELDIKLDNEAFNNGGSIDLTNSTLQEIKASIKRSNRIRMGKFTIQLKSDTGATVNIQIFEDKDRYFNGHRKIIPEKVNIKKDDRFNNQEWIIYFKNPLLGGSNIPLDIAADIVKWVQVVYKYPAFL